MGLNVLGKLYYKIKLKLINLLRSLPTNTHFYVPLVLATKNKSSKIILKHNSKKNKSTPDLLMYILTFFA